MNRRVYLSYILDAKTPTYGNRNAFHIEKKASIKNGDVANDSSIATTVHIGTHIDMPYHFYEDGQTIEDFSIEDFWYDNVLYTVLEPKNLVIEQELIDLLEKIDNKEIYDILIVKTGICEKRDEDIFWKENYGFSPKIAQYLRKNFPNIRAIGFDSISVSSFANRMIGREAHKAFLDPQKPILLIEDMDLTQITQNDQIQSIKVVPLRIAQCDGLPCTIVAEIK